MRASVYSCVCSTPAAELARLEQLISNKCTASHETSNALYIYPVYAVTCTVPFASMPCRSNSLFRYSSNYDIDPSNYVNYMPRAHTQRSMAWWDQSHEPKTHRVLPIVPQRPSSTPHSHQHDATTALTYGSSVGVVLASLPTTTLFSHADVALQQRPSPSTCHSSRPPSSPPAAEAGERKTKRPLIFPNAQPGTAAQALDRRSDQDAEITTITGEVDRLTNLLQVCVCVRVRVRVRAHMSVPYEGEVHSCVCTQRFCCSMHVFFDCEVLHTLCTYFVSTQFLHHFGVHYSYRIFSITCFGVHYVH